ncbi:alpha/beta fold hydrolase [Modestobacter sp. I12A-02628]|uniref:Alpha/beta fold hydrolase n=1 Tax=Goekera deserti TaxID=2497753 RepID=A0A7K3WIR8_9ACTN|nr:alpha/beta fold hydrolase [Goekera deserti]MPQ97048.1 alpha/beta fold hydrolase [Goekera deserti]NDI46635.1 alpha/beta fold hydrolase [Goekera deserti]NEL56391.1 alpha/beta fold hydrolase [Goekera deserti]
MQLVDHDVPTVLGRLRVRVGGGGPAVLLWPSLLTDGLLWRSQAALLADRHTVLLVDPPGHGASEPLTGGFTLTDCATALRQVLDHLDHEVAHVLGASWGGMVGGTFAALNPDRVGSCVLLNATATAAGRRQRLQIATLLRSARLLGGLHPPLTGQVVSAFLGPTSLRERPDAVRYVREAAQRVDMASVSWAVRSVVVDRPDQRRLFTAISTPVLVVAGAEDSTFPPAEGRALADAVPGAEFVIVDGAAHLLPVEVPGRVDELVGEFLRRTV